MWAQKLKNGYRERGENCGLPVFTTERQKKRKKKKNLRANFMAFNRASQVTERVNPLEWLRVRSPLPIKVGRNRLVGIATRYGLESPGIKSR